MIKTLLLQNKMPKSVVCVHDLQMPKHELRLIQSQNPARLLGKQHKLI